MNELLKDADNCVKCGLCLPTCPTYGKTQNENESPRGRIALIQAWAGGHLHDSQAVRDHIDNCLLCRECERVCPAEVPYSRLIDNFRSEFYAENKPSFALSVLKKVAQDKTTQGFTKSALKAYQTTPLQKIARAMKVPRLLRLDKMERLLTHYDAPQPLAEQYPATTEYRGTVGLFVGCMGSLLDAETIRATISVLTAVGFNVYIPAQQACCGALALHSGDKASAERLANTNTQAFAGQTLDAIVTLASGCGSQLQEYQQTKFANKIIDISQFLMQIDCDLRERLKPLAATVCLHTPCSLKNVMRSEQGALKLVQQIPELTVSTLPKTIICCGSAGSYMLEHSAMAETLLADVLDAAETTQAQYLLSSNIGCALHIAAGLQERGIKMEVLHPVALIARQLTA
jgi:glycolate oxidase iron-sulfur subunit